MRNINSTNKKNGIPTNIQVYKVNFVVLARIHLSWSSKNKI